MNQRTKHTEPTTSSYDAVAYGYDYMYDGFGGSAQASQSAAWSRTLTEYRSSSWITDGADNACTERSRSVNQHLQYLPFGEQFIDQRKDHDIRYKFTTKEEDSEIKPFGADSPNTLKNKQGIRQTGYQYFGARYYASDLSIWLSVDPLADKYPSMSPYMYTAGNPVMLVDPDGRDIDPASVTEEIKNMINPSHENYNKAFAEKYKVLENDHSTMYSFNPSDGFTLNEKDQKEYGSISYNGTNDEGQYKIGINYSTDSGTSGMSNSSSLLEETLHAVQFSEGKIGFYLNESDGKYYTFALDLGDEAEAKIFAALNTKDKIFSMEIKMIKAYNKSGIEGVKKFILKRPSLIGYGELSPESINVIEILQQLNPSLDVNSLFDSKGKSTKKGLIMLKPK